MSIMVTGGAGFIGSKIVRKLLELGEEVVCFDMAPPRGRLVPYLDRIKVYRGDITQLPHLLEAVSLHQVRSLAGTRSRPLSSSSTSTAEPK